jgi:hypothetical protein
MGRLMHEQQIMNISAAKCKLQKGRKDKSHFNVHVLWESFQCCTILFSYLAMSSMIPTDHKPCIHRSYTVVPFYKVKTSKHFAACLQMLATLKCFSAEGNQGSNMRLYDYLGMGKGTITHSVDRGVSAFLSLHDQCFFGLLQKKGRKCH